MKKFNDVEELKSQLEKDKSFAKNENYMSSLRIQFTIIVTFDIITHGT